MRSKIKATVKTLTVPYVYVGFLAIMGHFFVDVMLSIWPLFKTMAHINIAKAGVAYGVAITGGEFLQIVFSRYADKGYHKALLIFGLLFASCPALFPYAGTFGLCAVLLLLTGMGSAAFHPTAAGLLGHDKMKNKAVFFALFQVAGNLGIGFGQLLFQATDEFFHGQTAVMLILPVLLCLCILRSKSFKTFQNTGENARESVSFKDIWKLFKCKPLRSLYFVQLCNQAVFWAIIFLLPDFLLRRHYDEWVAFGGGHLAFFCGAAFGCLPMAYLRRYVATSKIIAMQLVATTFLFYLFLTIPYLSVVNLIVLLFLVGTFLGSIMPLVLFLGSEFLPQSRAMVSAFLMGLVWVISEGLGVSIAGLLTLCFSHNAPKKVLFYFGLLLIPALFFIKPVIKAEKEQFTWKGEG